MQQIPGGFGTENNIHAMIMIHSSANILDDTYVGIPWIPHSSSAAASSETYASLSLSLSLS